MIQIDQQLIKKLALLKTPLIVGVSGLGGAGKSTFALALGKAINAPVVGVDSFMKDRTITDYSNWGIMDFDRLEREVLIPFVEDKTPIQYGHFDWEKNGIEKTVSLSQSGKIVVEGVGLFRPNILKYFAYKIWVDCPVESAIERGKKRDREEYQNPQDENWDGVWKKNDEQYAKAFRPKETADLIVDNC